MSVRKRTWTTAKGEQKEAWIADYTHNGRRRHQLGRPEPVAEGQQDHGRVPVA